MAKVEYCDLCEVPLKESDYYMLYITCASSMPQSDNVEEYYQNLNKVQKQVKELCPDCKEIFDQIFKLRKEKLGELADDILDMYKKPTKNPPHGDKKREQDKKKKKKKK